MLGSRTILIVVFAVLAAAGTACADLIPISAFFEVAPSKQPSDAYGPQLPQQVEPFFFLGSPNIAAPGSLGVGFLPDASDEDSRASQPQNVGNWDGPGSLDLCLYALLGVGAFRSAPWVKRFSIGVVPEWYHDGGPFQIGHSHAANPTCLCCAAPVYCFVQPDSAEDDLPLPQYRRKTIVSLWRISQFTPAVLAARGPPSNSLLR